MLFTTSLTALACFVTLAVGSASDDSSKPTDANQAVFSVDIDRLSEPTLLACAAAPNCETYQSEHGLKIRFKAGQEPGSTAYKQRFGASNETMSVPLPGENAPSAAAPRVQAASNTNVDMGDTKILYGSVKPYDVLHNIWDHCGSSTCDTHPFNVATTTVRIIGQGNSVRQGSTLTVTADGQYDGYGQRDAYITALLNAASHGESSESQRWRFLALGDRVETGTLTVYTQTDYIGVNKFSGGALQGFMTIRVDQAQEKSGGWCAAAGGVFATILGAIEPIDAGFFDIIGIYCAGAGL